MVAIGVAVVLLFVGAGAAATDTAGNCFGLSPKGAAEVAAEVAAEATSAACKRCESFWAFAGGAAEREAEVCDGEPSLFSTGSARSARGAVAAGAVLALAFAAVAAGDALSGSPASAGRPSAAGKPT